MVGEGGMRKKAQIAGEDEEEDECACQDGVSSCILYLLEMDTLTRKRVTDSHGDENVRFLWAVRVGSGAANKGLIIRE
jgi:hypothetical protein